MTYYIRLLNCEVEEIETCLGDNIYQSCSCGPAMGIYNITEEQTTFIKLKFPEQAEFIYSSFPIRYEKV